MARYDINSCVRWGGQWKHSDGDHILFENRIPALFRTRREARAYIEEKYGYIRRRPDLRAAPHHWRVPQAVRVEIRIK